MFLTKQDLAGGLYPEITQMMSRYSDALIDMSLATAESEIAVMLGSRYDIGPELAKTGTARHSYLLSLGRDMAIYHLYSLLENIPAHRVKRYDQAIEMLKMIQNGKSTLPGVAGVVVPDVPAQPTQIDYGSEPRRAPVLAPLYGPFYAPI